MKRLRMIALVGFGIWRGKTEHGHMAEEAHAVIVMFDNG